MLKIKQNIIFGSSEIAHTWFTRISRDKNH